ncbi:MAG: hypothetical protein Q9159_000663 [Coniocarpon cinnabarinum]
MAAHGANAGPVETTETPFPVRSRNAAAVVDGTRTEISCMMFADKIFLTIAQEGRLAHWVHVPLRSYSPSHSDRRVPTAASCDMDSAETDFEGSQLLPLSNLTATTILGASGTERDTLGQLFATQIASAMTAKTPEEERLLVLGLGLKKKELEREAFLKILEGSLRVLGV